MRVSFGIGNRLAALLSALVLSEHFQVPLQIVWPPGEEDCAGAFDSLFERESFGDIEIIDEADGPWVDAKGISSAALKEAFSNGEAVRIRAYTLFGIDLLEGYKFFERFRAHLRAVRLSPQVTRKFPTDRPSKIGMHLRFTDHFPCTVFSPRWSYLVTARELVQLFPQERIFVCADSPHFAKEIGAILGQNAVLSRTLDSPKERIRSSLAGTQAALADLWSLANCRVIVSSPHSSFAMIALTLGGGLHCPVAIKTETIRHRQARYAWALFFRLSYDAATDAWSVLNKPTEHCSAKFSDKLLGRFALQFTRPWYQDHPPKFLQKRLERRLHKLLLSPSCQNAMANP